MYCCVGIFIYLFAFVSNGFGSKACGPPYHIDKSRHNGTSDQTFPEGTAIQYFCDFSTTPYGWPIYTCTNGEWTNGAELEFYCSWKTCGEPEIEHGSYTVESYTVGNLATFQCDRGYRLKGSSTALCRIDRKWRRLPTCQIVRCPSPTGINHMDRFQNTHGREYNIYGNEIYNTCEEGFNLIGPSVQTCETNGQWTSPKPQCERISCGEPNVGNGGQAYYDHTNLMSMAFIECEEDAIFKGEEYIVCYEDGWSYGYCYGACDILPIQNGGAHHSRIKHDETLDWWCDGGYLKSVHGSVTCNDGRLTETPACRPVEFGNFASCPHYQDNDYSVSHYQDKCYIFINVHDKYHEAKQRCQQLGLSIVTIGNHVENEFIRVALQKLWSERTWIGIEWKSNQWKNWDGSSLSYSDWFRGEGKKGWFGKFEQCAVFEQRRIRRRLQRRWNDIRCHWRARVICTIDSSDTLSQYEGTEL